MKQKSILRNVLAVESDAILELLTLRQHTHPRAALRDVLQEVMEKLRCCPVAVGRALDWLRLHADQSIGRLRRTELIQLSKAIHRFWQRSTAKSVDASASR